MRLQTRWSAEAWPVVRVEFRRALELRSEIRRAGRFIHENASGVKAGLPGCPLGSSVRQSSLRARSRMTLYAIVGDPSRRRWAFQLIGHEDHKPPRNARLERLPEGTQSVYSAGAESGRHRSRRVSAPAERPAEDCD